MEGTIKTANSRGFGFIATKQGIDFFFHHSEYKGSWKGLLKSVVSGEEVAVSFDNDPAAPDGPRALSILPKNPPVEEKVVLNTPKFVDAEKSI